MLATILVLAPVPLWPSAGYHEFLHARSVCKCLWMRHLNSIAVTGDRTVWGVLNSRNHDVFWMDIQHGHIRNQWTSAVSAQLSWFAQWESTGQEPQVRKSVTHAKFPSVNLSHHHRLLACVGSEFVFTLCCCFWRQQEQREMWPDGWGSSCSPLYTEMQTAELLCCCVTQTFSETVKNSVLFFLIRDIF